MNEAEKPAESKQEGKTADAVVSQPAAAPPQQPPAGTDATGTDDNPQPPQPILVQLVGGDDLEPFEEQSLAISRETLVISRRTYRIAILGFLIALAAAVFVGVQVFEMTKQTQILSSQTQSAVASATQGARDTREQIRIAQRQADAAQDQVEAIRQQMRVDQRAWLGVIGISGVSAPAAGQPEAVGDKLHAQGYVEIPYSFIVKNTGKTPAKHLLIGSTDSFGADPHEPPDGGKVVNGIRTGVLFPDQITERRSTSPIRLDLKKMQAWQFGQGFVYVYVYMEYRDIFQDTKVHHTWMCSKFDYFGKQSFCHIWNDAD